MNADIFTYSNEPYYQENIFNLFGFSHSKLKEEKSIDKYSRKAILEKHKKLKGKSGKKTKLELEDYLRNDLVKRYLTIYKDKFDLKYFHFEAGSDEIDAGVTTGNLDIKVIFPTEAMLGNEEYLAIECKRINKLLSKKRYYIDHGLNRFITRQYYPETNSKVAWMLSFMEAEKSSQIEHSVDIVNSFNKLLEEDYNDSTIHRIGEKSISIDIDPTLDVYDSLIKRNDNSELTVYHIFLDYYELIED
jgi:hypothetical protein